MIKELENSDNFLFPGSDKNEVHKYIICIKNFNKESIYSKDKSEKAIKLIIINIYINKDYIIDWFSK